VSDKGLGTAWAVASELVRLEEEMCPAPSLLGPEDRGTVREYGSMLSANTRDRSMHTPARSYSLTLHDYHSQPLTLWTGGDAQGGRAVVTAGTA